MKRLVFTFSLRDTQKAIIRINDCYREGGWTSANVYETIPYETQEELDDMYEDLCMALQGLEFDCEEKEI